MDLSVINQPNFELITKFNFKTILTLGEAVTYQTNLQDDQIPLSSLLNRIKHEQTSLNKAIISWTPNDNEKPCIQSYEIIADDGRQFETSETRTEIEIVPCITYEITITPISLNGVAGTSSIYEFSAKEVGMCQNFYSSKIHGILTIF